MLRGQPASQMHHQQSSLDKTSPDKMPLCAARMFEHDHLVDTVITRLHNSPQQGQPMEADKGS